MSERIAAGQTARVASRLTPAQRMDVLLAYASVRRRPREKVTLGRIWRFMVARAKESWKRLLVFAALGFALSFVFNAYIMGKKYDGFRSPNRVAPVTGQGSALAGMLFWFLFTTLLFAVVGYRMKVGKERFWDSVREFPRTLRGLVRREPETALTRALVGFAGALVVVMLIGPSLTALAGAGVLLLVASALRPVLAALVGALWNGLLRRFLSVPEPGPAALAVGSAGAVAAAMVAMVVPGTGMRVVLLLFAVGGVVLASRLQAPPGTALVLFVLAGAVLVLLTGDPAYADDGGISECGGLSDWPGCDGTGELAERAALGGVAGAAGAAAGELIGEGADEEWDDGSGGGGGPDEEEDDGEGGMCSLPDDEQLDDEAADWIAAHPGADIDDFIAERTARHTAQAKREIAENDAKLAQLEKDIKKIDERLADIDETLRTPVKNWADMTSKERHTARTQMTKAWRNLNPKGDPAQLTAILNRLDSDPSLSPVDMMTYVIGETVLGLPGGVARAGQRAVHDITGGGNAGELLYNTAANYWDDVVSGKALEHVDALGAKVVGGLMTASDYYGSQSASQILADYKQVMKATGQTAQNVTLAQVEQARKGLLALEQAAITGDAPAIAKVLDDAGGTVIFEFLTGAAAGKAVKVGGSGLKMLTTKADDLLDAAKARRATTAAKAPDVDIRTAPHGTPIDSVEKARTLGHSQTEIKAIQEISTDNDVIIRTRPGSEDRLKLLEAGGIGKPEHIKSKSINAADIELGFRKDDLGKIGHLTDDMYARLKSVDPASLSADGRKRLQQRLTEHVDRVGDLKKLEKGVNLRVPDPTRPGKLKTTQFKAAPDEHGVMRTPDGSSFNGDLDIGDITHSDGRPFFVDHDGRPLTGAALRADRELMVKIQHQLREKAGTLHGGGYWDPKPVIKKGKDGIPTVDCANIRINEAISKEAGPGGKALVEFTPGGATPTTAYGTGKPRKKYTGYKPWEAEKADPVTGKKKALTGPKEPAKKPAKPAPSKPGGDYPTAKPKAPATKAPAPKAAPKAPAPKPKAK